MRIANCEVRLGGDPLNSVPKRAVTIAEIALLQAIHGVDAVHKIEELENDRRPDRDELRRLRQRYGQIPDTAKALETLWQEYGAGFPKEWSDLEIPEVLFASSGAAANVPLTREQQKRKDTKDLADPMTQEQDDFSSPKIKERED